MEQHEAPMVRSGRGTSAWAFCRVVDDLVEFWSFASCLLIRDTRIGPCLQPIRPLAVRQGASHLGRDYRRDQSIDATLAKLGKVGARDSRVQVIQAARHTLRMLYKAWNWYEIKDDHSYTALWIPTTVHSLAEVDVGLRSESLSEKP